MSDSEDRIWRMTLTITTDASDFANLSQQQYAAFTKKALLETLRKLDTYLESASDDPKVIVDDLPAWYHGSVVIDGEVIEYRWSNLE